MAAIITYPTAMEYWLMEEGIPYHFRFDPVSSVVKNKEVQKTPCYRTEILENIGELKFQEPVHVLTTENTPRNTTETVIFHRVPKKLPANCFLKISDGIYICSPEYCFLQAAQFLSFPELVLLANDLCAIYIKNDEEEYHQRRREPVTTVKKLRSFLKQAENIRGIQRARSAIRFAQDRSNSPMESRLAVLARLPLSRGGYALPEMKLNFKLSLPKMAAEYLGREHCVCDMVWEEQRVILEYDSTLSHLSKEQHVLDKERATALMMADYKVVSATSEQVKSFGNVETLFLNLRRELRLRTHQDRMDWNYELRKAVVSQLLFADRKKQQAVSAQGMYIDPEIWNNEKDEWETSF